jgi:hypothetical protein
VSEDATYCKIIEFEVSWPENIETKLEFPLALPDLREEME